MSNQIIKSSEMSKLIERSVDFVSQCGDRFELEFSAINGSIQSALLYHKNSDTYWNVEGSPFNSRFAFTPVNSYGNRIVAQFFTNVYGHQAKPYVIIEEHLPTQLCKREF